MKLSTEVGGGEPGEMKLSTGGTTGGNEEKPKKQNDITQACKDIGVPACVTVRRVK